MNEYLFTFILRALSLISKMLEFTNKFNLILGRISWVCFDLRTKSNYSPSENVTNNSCKICYYTPAKSFSAVSYHVCF